MKRASSKYVDLNNRKSFVSPISGRGQCVPRQPAIQQCDQTGEKNFLRPLSSCMYWHRCQRIKISHLRLMHLSTDGYKPTHTKSPSINTSLCLLEVRPNRHLVAKFATTWVICLYLGLQCHKPLFFWWHVSFKWQGFSTSWQSPHYTVQLSSEFSMMSHQASDDSWLMRCCTLPPYLIQSVYACRCCHPKL